MLANTVATDLSKAIISHFATQLSSYTVTVEGHGKETSVPRVEIRLDGPFYSALGSKEWRVVVETNILVLSNTGQNIYTHSDMVGKVAAAFTPITLEETEEPPSGISGCLNLLDSVRVDNFGQLAPDKPVQRSTVEGRYEIILKEQ